MKKRLVLIASAKGQSLVELAISLVVLVYLLSGAVEFGMAFFQYVQLRDAAQEGALYGSTHPKSTDLAGITDRIKYSSDRPINLPSQIGVPGGVTVTIGIDDDGNTATPAIPSTNTASYDAVACEGNNHGITVQVSYTHNVFMPFMCPAFGICQIPLNASVTDTILTPECTP